MSQCFKFPIINRGFTLVELMIVVAIMSILATSAMPSRELIVKREKEQQLRTALWQIRSAIDAYKMAVDDGRIVKKEEESGYPPTLDDLVMGVTDIKSSEKKLIYFLRRLPRDPLYKEMDVAGIETVPAIETWGKRSYESPPDNPQEGDDVFDIYSLSEATSLNGTLYTEW
jgi:general secretion pathway protein G